MIQVRYGTAASAAQNNVTLGAGEFAVEIDTGLVKAGNGNTPYNSLEYITDLSNLPAVVQNAVKLANSAAQIGGDLGGTPASPQVNTVLGGQTPVTPATVATQVNSAVASASTVTNAAATAAATAVANANLVVATDTSPSTGYGFAVTDQNGAVSELATDLAGKLVITPAMLTRIGHQIAAAPKSSLINMAAYGDSITASGQGGGSTWETYLTALLPLGVNIKNNGVSGSQSGLIAFAQGGIQFQASASVTIPTTPTVLGTLSAGFAQNANIPSLPVNALAASIAAGTIIQIGSAGNYQWFTVAPGGAAQGATSIPIVQPSPVYATFAISSGANVVQALQIPLQTSMYQTTEIATLRDTVTLALDQTVVNVTGETLVPIVTQGIPFGWTDQNGYFPLPCSIGGVAGLLNAYTQSFAPTAFPSSPVVISANTAFAPMVNGVPTGPIDAQKMQFLWAGRNDVLDTQTNIIDGCLMDIQAMVNYLKASIVVPRFFIVPILNPPLDDEPVAGAHLNYQAQVQAINTRLQKMYPYNFVDLNAYLITNATSIAAAAGITLTSTDQAEIAAGFVPGSFTVDNLHPNDGCRHYGIAPFFAQQMALRDWNLA